MNSSASISEYFCSFQGEGPYLGTKQFFIRFSDCNIPHCRFCDTINSSNKKKVFKDDLILSVLNEYKIHNFKEISLTGGEPLLYCDFIFNFLKDLFEENKFFIYLETNSTISDAIPKIHSYIDMVSADFKFSSVTNQRSLADKHTEFFKKLEEFQMDYFIKCVVNNNIDKKEFSQMCDIILKNCKKRSLILQPEMLDEQPQISFLEAEKLYDIAHQKGIETRIIPQTHKILKFQ
ncbi:MAG: 7-carboxy-7-deazaguanine synthase QueE [Candidatus Aureabacteria bacterium]|nr:7-carboxy-7-deazaguanine synthase QueE [Candidatus Auribacterota bacterium]